LKVLLLLLLLLRSLLVVLLYPAVAVWPAMLLIRTATVGLLEVAGRAQPPPYNGRG